MIYRRSIACRFHISHGSFALNRQSKFHRLRSSGRDSSSTARCVPEMISYQPLETVIRTPPLGLRCVDIATRAPVTEGLRITATLKNGAGKTVLATPTPSGVHAFQNLPGMHDFEYGVQNLASSISPPLTSPPFGKDFAIQVEDNAGHFLPWGLVLTLPRPEIVTTPLFSAPSRLSVPGFIAIRGGLKDKGRPPRADGSLKFA